ncbi:unnamed protein product [Euphydryas editha]|uniref:Uncharacterized protein n=1 Tax=Euphydryas editha TaxID=104508 RepID=A0AAU9TJX0_EUPED|nr:unnamed protein product [Euphydryas editha]
MLRARRARGGSARAVSARAPAYMLVHATRGGCTHGVRERLHLGAQRGGVRAVAADAARQARQARARRQRQGRQRARARVHVGSCDSGRVYSRCA